MNRDVINHKILPIADKINTKADIVFCIDSTGSMKPCIDGVKNAVYEFVAGLQSAANVDFRLRLIAYRDLHDPSWKGDPWKLTQFTSSIDKFRTDLSNLSANGGGDNRGAESTLDALYHAIHSDWRLSKTYKAIVLLTDDNTHPTLHSSTYSRHDNDIYRVIQDFQGLRHILLYMVLPDYPAYQQIERSMNDADRKIVAYYIPKDDPDCEGLKSVDWQSLLKMLGETISITSVVVAQSSER